MPEYIFPESGKPKLKKKSERKVTARHAGGKTWIDPTLDKWEKNDYRVFCGNLGNDVTEDVLKRAFSRYSSLLQVRVVGDKRTGKSRGYGFVSFGTAEDFLKAMKEVDGTYVGNRPIKLRKSQWADRNIVMKGTELKTLVKRSEHPIRR